MAFLRLPSSVHSSLGGESRGKHKNSSVRDSTPTRFSVHCRTMLWLAKKFLWSISTASALVGLLFIAADFQDREHAFDALGRVLTVSNREILLFFLCSVCVARLLYLDLKRSINDQDWPPVSRKIYDLLKVVFRRDARIAKLKLITDDSAVIAYKKALLAEHVLATADLSHISQMRPPSSVPPPSDFAGDSFGQHLENHERRISDRASWLIMNIGIGSDIYFRKVYERLKLARERAYEDRASWPGIENGGYFSSEWERNKFHELHAQTKEINRIIDEFRQSLEETRNWHHAVDEETRRRLMEDIAEMIPTGSSST